MFIMCQAMGFKHLPMDGGLYDQNPDMLDRFMHIFQMQSQQREREEAEKRRRQGGPTPRNAGAPLPPT